MYLKYSFIIAFIIQFYIGSTAGVFDDLPHYMLKDSNLSHILEYTLAFTILAYFYTMAYDLKGFKFVYENKQWLVQSDLLNYSKRMHIDFYNIVSNINDPLWSYRILINSHFHGMLSCLIGLGFFIEIPHLIGGLWVLSAFFVGSIRILDHYSFSTWWNLGIFTWPGMTPFIYFVIFYD